MKLKGKKVWKQIAVMILISLAACGAIELLYNVPVWLGRSDKLLAIAAEDVKTKNFEQVNGMLVKKPGKASVTLDFEEQYVDKIKFDYDGNTSTMECEIKIETEDREGNEKIKTITEKNNVLLDASVTNVRCKAKSIRLIFNDQPVAEGMEEDEASFKISGFEIDNTGSVSLWRMAAVFAVAFLILLTLWLSREIAIKTEVFFVIAGLFLGGICLISQPGHKISWDEEIHFQHAYSLSYRMELKNQMYYPPAASLLGSVSRESWPYDVHTSKEEYIEEAKRWSQIGTPDLKDNSEYYSQLVPVNFKTVGYVMSALFIELGKLLHLPFSMIYMMGRLGNLLMYLAVIYLAIRHIPFGKKTMMALGLMPTPLFLASTYSYDATVIAFSFLAISYMLGEILSEREHVEIKNVAIFAGALVIVSLVKAIYAPMLLLGLMIPKAKFRDAKQKKLVWTGIIVLTLLLLSTFVLPALFASPSKGGDLRGGDTSVGRQMRVVFGHPVQYAMMLLKTMADYFLSFSIAGEGVGMLGHGGIVPYISWIPLVLSGVALTERNEGTRRLSKKEKTVVAFTLFVVTAFIWTAMYLSFTPVGSDYFAGVQGRYFLPVTMMGLLLLNNRSTEFRGDRKNYDRLVCIAVTLVTAANYYFAFTVNCY